MIDMNEILDVSITSITIGNAEKSRIYSDFGVYYWAILMNRLGYTE